MLLQLSPSGRLLLKEDAEAPELEADLALSLRQAFLRGSGFGLLQLGTWMGRWLPPAWAWWRDFTARFLTLRCHQEEREIQIPPPLDFFQTALLSAPLMPGEEYLGLDVLETLWVELEVAFDQDWKASGLSLQAFLNRLNPAWNLVGRVHFHLAENRKDEETPFAFLATYSHELSQQGRARHLPLGQALKEYAGKQQKSQLLNLLLPVQRASEHLSWLRHMVEAGELFHPLRWKASEAYRLLQDLPRLEEAGIVVRMPASWKMGRPARPRVTAIVGGKNPSGLGFRALLDFSMGLSLEGETLSSQEIQALLKATEGLAFIRGQWVEVDPTKLQGLLSHFRDVQERAARDGLPFAEALRLLSGASIGTDVGEPTEPAWAEVKAGPWLEETLRHLRNPDGAPEVDPGPELRATLRPYQQAGLRWLHFLSRLQLGACLADDMGLGKTIQVLTLLLVLRKEGGLQNPALLVAPASLLANWAAELERFTPTLRSLVAHPSTLGGREWKELKTEDFTGKDLILTSYGTLTRSPELFDRVWSCAVIDEAQAIKNPGTRQSRAVKHLRAHARIALTGTPVENRLGDLWSIFDFTHPGLLGSPKDFALYVKSLEQVAHNPFGPLRSLVQPYILRRLKTDKRVIQDLPDKTELRAYCALSPKQAALYQQGVAELAQKLEKADGIQRRGLILSFLLRFKQICNHPSHWLGDGGWEEPDSGKWSRLREICEVIAQKQEKVLVFTQFREVCEPLFAFLAELFGAPGLVLHGGTAVKDRQKLVKRFQEEEGLPFFLLSLKAGGSGLNLTAASHVIHFDRWWNPAVENQATDRAFRIGQKRNVLVHKFICRGTVEEKIDTLIESKTRLSQELLEGDGEMNLTEMSNDAIMELVSLDLKSAIQER